MTKNTINYYMHQDKDSNWDYGEELGLTGDARERFKYTGYEISFELEVDTETGKAYAVSIEGQTLNPPVAMN